MLWESSAWIEPVVKRFASTKSEQKQLKNMREQRHKWNLTFSEQIKIFFELNVFFEWINLGVCLGRGQYKLAGPKLLRYFRNFQLCSHFCLKSFRTHFGTFCSIFLIFWCVCLETIISRNFAWRGKSWGIKSREQTFCKISERTASQMKFNINF